MPFPKSSAVGLCVLSLFTASVVVAQEVSIASRVLKGNRINELGIWNLGADKSFEIFATTVAGRAACYRADTLEPLWEKQVLSEALTAPVIGDFTGTGAPILAFGSAAGEVLFIWPGTGEVIATLKTDMGFAMAPSVAVMQQRALLVLGDEQGRIAVVSMDTESYKASLLHEIPNSVKGTTAFSVIGSFSQPPTCSDLDGDGSSEIVTISNSGVLQVVSLPAGTDAGQEPRRYHTRLAQQSRATTVMAAGSMGSDQPSMILLGVDASIHAYLWDGIQAPARALQAAFQAPAYGSSQGHLLLGQINGDASADLISTANNTIACRYLGRDFNGNQTLLDIAPQHLSTTAPPFSPAVATEKSDGSPAIVAVDGDGIAWEWLPRSPQNTMQRHSGVPVPTSFTPAGNLTGDGKLSLVVWDEREFKLSVVTLPVDVSPNAAPILTLGGNFSRNGHWGSEWAEQWQQMMTASTERIKQARTALEQTPDDTELPTDPVSTIAGLAPEDSIAVEFREKHSQTSTGGAGLLGLVAIAVIAAIGFAFWKARRR